MVSRDLVQSLADRKHLFIHPALGRLPCFVTHNRPERLAYHFCQCPIIGDYASILTSHTILVHAREHNDEQK